MRLRLTYEIRIQLSPRISYTIADKRIVHENDIPGVGNFERLVDIIKTIPNVRWRLDKVPYPIFQDGDDEL